MKDETFAGADTCGVAMRTRMPRAIRNLSLALMVVVFAAVSALPAAAAGITLKVSLWGDMTGSMPTDLGLGMGKAKGAAHGINPKMGITIYRHSIKAGKVTFAVKNNSEKTIHEMLVLPIKNTSTRLPYLKNENRLDETKTHSLGEVSELDPGKAGTLTLNLKPGKYLLTCNVPGHYAAGMWTVLTVTP